MHIRRTISLLAVAGLALVGCGDGGAEEAPPTTTEAPATDGEAEDGAEDGPTVTVRDIAFQEQTTTVQAGTPVTWVNEDSVAHTVTSGAPDDPTGVFDEELPAGGEVSITVDEPGTYQYFCQIHPSMTAELVVEG